MFSSTNPSPYFSSSFHFSSPSPINHHEMSLHHHKDLLVSHYSSPTNAHGDQALETTVHGGLNGHHHQFPTKKAVRKDRHSKITTSKGPRERRVRLSIGIARRFFDLQDMLGFDKASKTLDWLFAKSKTAIAELVHMNLGSSIDETTTSTDNGDTQGTKTKQLKPVVDRASLRLLSKESRAKARERARERTRGKMCNNTRSRVHESDIVVSNSSTVPYLLNELGAHDSDITICSRYCNVDDATMSQNQLVPRDEDMIDEPMVMKGKLEPSLLFDYDLQDLSNYSPNVGQCWDIGSAIARSSFCVMTSMNLSTEFQIYGKPWEVCNNHSQL